MGDGEVEQAEECGFCTDGVLTYRGRSERCPYCGGSGRMHVVDLGGSEDGRAE